MDQEDSDCSLVPVDNNFLPDTTDNREKFHKSLQLYWKQKNITFIKQPTIGGKDLDFYILYTSVCMRGGAIKVSEIKLWREIVNELKLPQSCTSASFTLKNHYSKYLLGFEMIHMHKQKDVEQIPTLAPGRNFKNENGKDADDQAKISTQKQDLSEKNPIQIKKGLVQQKSESKANLQDSDDSMSEPEEVNQNTNSRKLINTKKDNSLDNSFEKEQKKKFGDEEEIIYYEEMKLFPTNGDLKRIVLAFKSVISDDIAFAINQLLLYSVNMQDPFVLEKVPNLLESMTIYLENIIQRVPELRNEQRQNNQNHVYEVYQNLNDYPIGTVLLFNQKNNTEISPISLLQKNTKSKQQQKFEMETGKVYLDQARTIFLILRNLSYQQINEKSIQEDGKLIHLMFILFCENKDQEISNYILEIIASLGKSINFKLIPKQKQFTMQLYEYLKSDEHDLLESTVDILRQCIPMHENQIVFEREINMFLHQICGLLSKGNVDIKEGLLEFLCYLTDQSTDTKVKIASYPRLMERLITLLGSGIGKQNQRLTKLAALVLNNLSFSQKSRQYIFPFEEDILLVASTDESVSRILSDILNEIDSYSNAEEII